MIFISPLRRLAIINNVPPGRRRREALDEAEVWPLHIPNQLHIPFPALEKLHIPTLEKLDILALETKIQALGGENPEGEWTDIGGKMLEGRRSPHEGTLFASFAEFDEKQLAEKKQTSESQADSLSKQLGELVKEMVRWIKEEDFQSVEKGMRRDGEDGEEESCLVSSWRCLSTVLEQGVTCFQRPRAFQR